MNQKLLVTLAIAIHLVIIFSYIASAEIIWSNPTTVTFSTIKSDDNQNKDKTTTSCKGKNTVIETENFYGEWQCISGRLQRTVIIDGVQKTEKGEACGFNLDSEDDSFSHNAANSNKGTVISSSFMIYPIILIILVLMSIIGIALIFLIK